MDRKITLAYGDGGELAHKLIQQIFVSALAIVMHHDSMLHSFP
jgi:hypothetical protein